MTESQDEVEVPKIIKKRKPITEKQKAARQANLKKGRETRLKNLAAQKTTPKYDLESSSDSEVDMDSIVMKRVPKKGKGDDNELQNIKKEMEEMRSVMWEMQKKQKKKKKSAPKINVLLPQSQHEKVKDVISDLGFDRQIRELMAAVGVRK